MTSMVGVDREAVNARSVNLVSEETGFSHGLGVAHRWPLQEPKKLVLTNQSVIANVSTHD
jgi:hypothetical protein